MLCEWLDVDRANPRQDLALSSRNLLDVHQLLDERLEPGVVEIKLELQCAQRDAALLFQIALHSPDCVEKAHSKSHLSLRGDVVDALLRSTLSEPTQNSFVPSSAEIVALQ